MPWVSSFVRSDISRIVMVPSEMLVPIEHNITMDHGQPCQRDRNDLLCFKRREGQRAGEKRKGRAEPV